jgi:hypothetical protein
VADRERFTLAMAAAFVAREYTIRAETKQDCGGHGFAVGSTAKVFRTHLRRHSELANLGALPWHGARHTTKVTAIAHRIISP